VIAAINKDPSQQHSLQLEHLDGNIPSSYSMRILEGKSPDSYNDINKTEAEPSAWTNSNYKNGDVIVLPPHSVSILKFN
jgi:hypothetical protein